MAGRKIDVVQELQRARAKDKTLQEKILEQFKWLLHADDQMELEIRKNLGEANCHIENIRTENLDDSLIFDLEDIRKICLTYRLRFLDSHHFKGEIPREAINKIKALQKKQDMTFNSFKIIAPSALFQLGDANDRDPLLFLNLGDGRFYFIHKWGHDLNWFRKLLAWPVREARNLLITVVTILALVVYSLPQSWFLNPANVPDTSSYRMFLFFYLLIASCGLLTFFGLAFHKNFSSEEWDSRFFN